MLGWHVCKPSYWHFLFYVRHLAFSIVNRERLTGNNEQPKTENPADDSSKEKIKLEEIDEKKDRSKVDLYCPLLLLFHGTRIKYLKVK